MPHEAHQINSFGLLENKYINIYSEDNPILHPGDEAFFLFHNMNDYHRLIIGKGIVISDDINDSLHKTYFFKLLEIVEPEDVINNFSYKKLFQFYKLNEQSLRITGSKTYVMSEKVEINFDIYLIRVDGFFTRKTLEAIQELQYEFSQIIREDLRKQLSDLDYLDNGR